MFKFIIGLVVGIVVISLFMSLLYIFWFKKICVSEDETPLETIAQEEDEENVKVFNTVKDFMRFVNNYEGEIIIRNNVIYDTDNNKIAKYKKEVVK